MRRPSRATPHSATWERIRIGRDVEVAYRADAGRRTRRKIQILENLLADLFAEELARDAQDDAAEDAAKE